MRKKTIVIAGAAAAVLVVGLGGAGIAYAVTDGFDTPDQLTGSAFERASAVAVSEIGGGAVTSAERDDAFYELELVGSDGVRYDVVLDESYNVVTAHPDDDGAGRADRAGGRDGSDDSDDRDDRNGSDSSDDRDDRDDDGIRPATGAADDDDLVGEELSAVSAAALAAVGEGTVEEAERNDDDDDGHRYDVEIRLADGSDVDVDLDASYTVVNIDR
jgi:uncharacterized membrane protein YkoI